MIDVVEGWTGPIDFILKNDGVVEDLTGKTVAGVFKDRDGVAVDMSGDVSVVTPAAGTVRYMPDAPDLVAAKSPYSVRFQVTDGAGKIVFFPNGQPEILNVNAP